MNANQMSAVLRRAAAVYSKEITSDLVAAWLELCGDMSPQLVAAALNEYMREGDWFPKPSEVRRIAKRIHADQAREANRQHLTRTGRELDEAAVTRNDGYAMLSFILGRIKAAGSNPSQGQLLGVETARKVALDALDEWRERHPTPAYSTRSGQHCGRDSCRCTHTDGCEGGWVEVGPDAAGNPQVRSCKTCNERRYRVLTAGDNRKAAMFNLRVTADMEKRQASA